MKEGDIILTPLPQADGKDKPRPALLLREMPPFGDFLVCGISSQLHQGVPGFDEWIRTADNDFAELDAAASRADILATPVVFGTIRIRSVGGTSLAPGRRA